MYPGMKQDSVFATEDIIAILGRQITNQEHKGDFEQMLEFVVEQALLAQRKYTNSYRGFRVGCAVYAHNGGKIRSNSRVRVFTAGNLKPAKHIVKLCAERRAVLKAQAEGYPHIIGMVIAGLPQADVDSLLVTPTLHPCKACRNFFASTLGIHSTMQIVTITPQKDRWERMTLGELMRFHKTH